MMFCVLMHTHFVHKITTLVALKHNFVCSCAIYIQAVQFFQRHFLHVLWIILQLLESSRTFFDARIRACCSVNYVHSNVFYPHAISLFYFFIFIFKLFNYSVSSCLRIIQSFIPALPALKPKSNAAFHYLIIMRLKSVSFKIITNPVF